MMSWGIYLTSFSRSEKNIWTVCVMVILLKNYHLISMAISTIMSTIWPWYLKWLDHSAWIRRLGFRVPLRSRHFLSQKPWHFHNNIRSCVENDCCCPRTVNISSVNFILKNNLTYLHDDVIKWEHFRVTDPLCREFTSNRLIPPTKTSDAELWYFLWSAPEQKLE